MARGRFVVLEGIDGSGTTSQCAALAEALRARGVAVAPTCEPSDGALGRAARACLATNAGPVDPRALALAFAADRIDHVARVIEPALARGDTVLCDRYVLSSWAYQSLECELAWVREINRHAPWPDLTLWLDVDVETASRRVRTRAAADGTVPERFEVPAIQHHVAAAYAAFFASDALPGLFRVDGTRPAAEVTSLALALIDREAGPRAPSPGA